MELRRILEQQRISDRAGLMAGVFWLAVIALAGAGVTGCGGDGRDRTTESSVTYLGDSGTESSSSTTNVMTDPPRRGAVPEEEGLTREDDTGVVPLGPSELTADVQGGEAVLTWRGTGSDILVAYELLRKTVGDRRYRSIGRSAIEGDNRGYYSFTSDGVSGEVSYGVVAIDRDGMRSEMTVTAPAEAR